ncbi:MAG: hypothetical protein HYZ57_01350 [Acidobacteria bacterium]|nr:hypothetical protein [Acidobacteriota bacterium]
MPDDAATLKLGEVGIDNQAFELDLKVNAGYQGYAEELVRLCLLALAGMAAVWLKIFLDDRRGSAPTLTAVLLSCSFLCLIMSAAAALVQRYTAADSLAHHLTALRRRKRNRAAARRGPADAELAEKQFARRDALFKWSDRLLKASISLLLLGALLFAGALWPLTYR